jgi:hypothetical protein
MEFLNPTPVSLVRGVGIFRVLQIYWYHACEYLAPIATVLFSEVSEKKEWLQKIKTWLWQGKIKKIIQECQKHLHSLAADAADA